MLLPTLVFGQKSALKYSAGISLRPSMYKNQTQFENQKLFDLSRTLHIEGKLNGEFSMRLAFQSRQWQKEFRSERTCIACLESDRIIHKELRLLAPMISIIWSKKNTQRSPTATPYINLGFSQHFQLSSSTAHPYSQIESARIPQTEGLKIDKSYILLGAGMTYPIRKKWSLFLEPQIAKPLNGILASKQYDLGISIGSLLRL